jgi:hypothetical protein
MNKVVTLLLFLGAITQPIQGQLGSTPGGGSLLLRVQALISGSFPGIRDLSHVRIKFVSSIAWTEMNAEPHDFHVVVEEQCKNPRIGDYRSSEQPLLVPCSEAQEHYRSPLNIRVLFGKGSNRPMVLMVETYGIQTFETERKKIQNLPSAQQWQEFREQKALYGPWARPEFLASLPVKEWRRFFSAEHLAVKSAEFNSESETWNVVLTVRTGNKNVGYLLNIEPFRGNLIRVAMI